VTGKQVLFSEKKSEHRRTREKVIFIVFQATGSSLLVAAIIYLIFIPFFDNFNPISPEPCHMNI